MTAATTETLQLRDGSVATLVRHPAPAPERGAVLYVHGFSDYFFQTHVAEHFVEQGYDFYGIDLRRYGRSLRPGDVPCFVEDLSVHFEELDAAACRIRDDGHECLVVIGHSTGGLITPLWLDARREDPALAGFVRTLVLNSPWFDLVEPRPVRMVLDPLIRIVARWQPQRTVRELGPVYGQSIHRDHHGEWDFDLKLKPINGFPGRFAWIRAVRAGQRHLQRGLAVGVPVLVLRSSTSLLGRKEWSPDTMHADTVLNVEDMSRLAPRLGSEVEVIVIENGMHDLFLSPLPARDVALTTIDEWLDRREQGR